MPPKVKIFAWKVGRDALSTGKVNKKGQEMETVDICLICQSEQEDTFHALSRCLHAQATGSDVGKLLGFSF